MVVLNGTFDGTKVVLDTPVPSEIAANTPVRVIFDDAPAPSGESALSKIAKLAKPGGFPRDFAEQHDHYIKGTPRR
jgi:hypothetical protein